MAELSCVDPVLFEGEFELFLKHVHQESGVEFTSFNANPYTWREEGYKSQIQQKGREKLGTTEWQADDIGDGKIARAVIEAIELSENNLVKWQKVYGLEKTPHYELRQALKPTLQLEKIESILFNLYSTNDDEATFRRLVDMFGKKYSLIAYLFFLKDSSRYMPIAPQYFDKSFKRLGVQLVTSKHCSWENYQLFNDILSELKLVLSEKLSTDVSLLDAHSFAWMLSYQMKEMHRSKKHTEYAALLPKTKKAIIEARLGQGPFRKEVLKYWTVCAVTGCAETSLLEASHIKPWKDCQGMEHIDPYNGLLLVPSVHKALDAGFISFADDGQLVLSEKLSEDDAKALGIDKEQKLTKIEKKHCPYLKYHRENRFNNGRVEIAGSDLRNNFHGDYG